MKRWYKRIATATSMFLLSGMLTFSPIYATQQTTRAQKGKTYALLIGGGTTEKDDHEGFYNCVRLMYDTLIKQKVNPENIKVLFKEGKTLGHKIVDSDATKPIIKNALAEYSNLSENDTLIIYRAGHGGLTWKEGKDGEELTLSEMELEGYDYTVPCMKEPNRITQEEFAEMIKNIKAKKFVLLQQCHPAGFIEITKDLKKLVVIAAERKGHTTKKWLPNEYWDLTLYTCAAISGELKGKSVNADKNGDGLVSIIEAFEFSIKNMPASTMGFIEEYNREGHYSAYKEQPQIDWSKDIDPNKIILGDYAFKDKNLPPDKTIGLRKKVLKLVNHAVEKGEHVMSEPIFGEEYQISRGEYTFSVNGRFFPARGTPKTPENFVPIRITVLHTMKVDPKTKQTLKQRIISDGKLVHHSTITGKFSFSGCDSEPDYDSTVTKSRDKEGSLEIKTENRELDDKQFEEYNSIINYLCEGL